MESSKEMNALITLAKFHYEFGFIGHDECLERVHVALWLSDEINSDPRIESLQEEIQNEREESESENESVISTDPTDTGTSGENDDSWVEFLFLGVWVFTKSDRDSYPSVPHGHYEDKKNKWPKLNPYTGRVFSSKCKEDVRRRLSRKELKIIWNDKKFRSFCREMIISYQETFPYYDFPVRIPSRLPRRR